MDAFGRVTRTFCEGYKDLNQRLTPSMTLGLLASGLGAYTVYSFGIKPFLSPLRQLPGPGYNPIFGNVREAMVGQAMETSVKWVKQYGGVVRFYHLLGREQVLLADPEALKYVLVTNEENYARDQSTVPEFIGTKGVLSVTGKEHKRQRILLNPFFNHASVDGYLSIFENCTQQLLALWQQGLQDEQSAVVSVQQDLSRMALDAIGLAVFDCNFNCLENPDSELPKSFNFLASQTGISFTGLIPYFAKLPTHNNKKQDHCNRLLNETVYGIIEKKKQLLETEEGKQQATKDLLGKMMLVRDEGGQGFTDTELRDQVLTLLLAGHETTAVTVSWLLLLLAQHPEIQDRLRSEVTAHLPDSGSPLTWNHLEKMKYLNCVIKEGQRLYPAAPSFTRRAVKDDVVNGYCIPAGTVVVFHFGAMMRNPAIWPDPEKFDPERFADGKEINLYNYLPFNTGPHKCLGHQFAKLEMKTIIALLLRDLKFELIPGARFVRKMRITLKAFPPVKLAVSQVQ